MGAMQQPSLGGGDLASAVNAAIAQRAMQYATPQQLPQIQHSAMLAEALQSIQKSGSQGLRTKGALASNLLAEALLAMASNKANKQVAATDQSNWKDRYDTTMGMLSGQDAPPAPASAPQTADQAPTGPTPQPTAQAAPAPSPQPPAQQYSDADRAGIANAVWGEARGEPDAGKQAVADVILNRAKATGLSPAAVVAQPHQFSGFDPNRHLSPQQQQAMLSAVDPALQGQDITGGADHFFNPQLAHPSWGQGPGQMFGHQKFMALNDQGARSATGAGTPAAAQAPMPQPLQVANGPQPSMPAPNAQPFAQNPGAPPSPANSAPQGAAPSPQGQGQWALGPVPIQPQQRAHLQQLGQMAQSNPAFRQPFMEYAQELQKQETTPEPYDSQIINGNKVLVGKVTGRQVMQPIQGLPIDAKAMMVPDGRGGFVPVQSTQEHQLQGAAPGVRSQQDITGHISDSAIPNAVVDHQVYTPSGYQPLAGLQPHVTPAGGGGAQWVTEPGKGPQLVQGPVTAEMVAKRGEQFTGRDEVKAARSSLEAMNAYNRAMQSIAPSGVVGQAGIDAYIHAVSSPNQGVRQGPVNVFLDHQNLPDEVKGEAQRLFGKGFLTPQVLKQIGQMVWLYTNERVKTAQGLSQTDSQWAKQGGFDPGALGESSPQMMPVPAYIQDPPPPMNGRRPGMVIWSPKGPVKWNGKAWDPANG